MRFRRHLIFSKNMRNHARDCQSSQKTSSACALVSTPSPLPYAPNPPTFRPTYFLVISNRFLSLQVTWEEKIGQPISRSPAKSPAGLLRRRGQFSTISPLSSPARGPQCFHFCMSRGSESMGGGFRVEGGEEPPTCIQLNMFAPWLVWISGLSGSLQTKGLPVPFPVKAHDRVVGQVPTRGRSRGYHTLMFLPLPLSLSSFL